MKRSVFAVLVAVIVCLGLLLPTALPVSAGELSGGLAYVPSMPGIYYVGDTIHYEMFIQNPVSWPYNWIGDIWYVQPDGSTVLVDTYVTLVPGQRVNYELDWVIQESDLQWAEISGQYIWAVESTLVADGFHDGPPPLPDDPSGLSISLLAQVIIPATNLTIWASPSHISAGESATLTIAECNTGDTDIIDPWVDLDGIPLGSPNRGDTDADGVIDGYFSPTGPECWVWEVTVNPTTTTTYTATGHGTDLLGSPVPATNETDSVDILVEVACTSVSVAANPMGDIGSGDPVFLTVSECNCGDVELTDVEVAITANGKEMAVSPLVAPPDSGDKDMDGVLDRGECWNWGVVDYPWATTLYAAIGHGLTPSGLDVTIPAFPGEADWVVVHDTNAGSDVEVDLVEAKLTFEQVIKEGTTALESTSDGPALPTWFRLGDPPTYFDITTTATYDGAILVCIDYSDIAFEGDESKLKLWQMTDSGWVEITWGDVDTVNNIICGRTNELSWFTMGTIMPFETKLIASDGAAVDEFGESVAISGGTLIVGAHRDDVGLNEDQGSAYVFVRSGTIWVEQAKLTASDGEKWDEFGYSVAIDGETAVVGAPRDHIGLNEDQGSAYVFVRDGNTWVEQAKLIASDGSANDWFGLSVAISGDTLIVGAHRDDVGLNEDQGSAYVFVRSGTIWVEQAKLTASDGASGDEFGSSVAVEGNTALVGARHHDVGTNINQGSAYVFVKGGTDWTEQVQLTVPDGVWIGSSVAINGDTAVAGAPGTCGALGVNQGSAHVFVRNGTVWFYEAKLTASDGAASDFFGNSVCIDGDTVVVASYADDIGANVNQGSAYVFVRSGSAWIEKAKLTASDGAGNDLFGDSVSIDGDTVVIGARLDDVGSSENQGSAYVYDASYPTLETLTEAGVARWDGSGEDDYPTAMVVDQYGNVFITGFSPGDVTGLDYATLKYGPDLGEPLWVSWYHGPSADIPVAMAIDDQGDVYVTGGSQGIGSDLDYLTVKYDGDDGTQLWERRYNWADGDDWATGIAVDNLGYVYVTGYSDDPSTGFDYATIKYDADTGDEVWTEAARYDSAGGDDHAWFIALDTGGYIYVTGQSVNEAGNSDLATIKYDANGNEVWPEAARYDGGGNEVAAWWGGAFGPFLPLGNAMAVDEMGNVFVTGSSEGAGGYFDYVTVKYDSNGNELWVARYDSLVSLDDRAQAIALDASGNVYVTGGSEGPVLGADYLTVKYDGDNGAELWVMRKDDKGTLDLAVDIAVDEFGNVFITGGGDSSDDGSDGVTIYTSDGRSFRVARYDGPDHLYDGTGALALYGSGTLYVGGQSKRLTTGMDYVVMKYVKSYSAYTPTGTDVVVDVEEATFTVTVTKPGETTLTKSATGPELPSTFTLGEPPVYYEVSTTAEYEPLVQVAIDYSGMEFANEDELVMLHWDGSEWKDVTTAIDMAEDIIYGQYTALSTWVVAQRVILDATVDVDPDVVALGAPLKYITVYIELPTDYDVSQIDISTIKLDDTVSALPKPTKIGDHDEDGVPDLMVKFDAAAAQGVLMAGDEVEILISGEVDGIRFEGSHTIRVIDRGRPVTAGMIGGFSYLDYIVAGLGGCLLIAFGMIFYFSRGRFMPR